MTRKGVVLLTAFLSFSAIAEVSLEEKQQRLDFITELPGGKSLNIDAYKREFNYQLQGLSEEEKAQQEVNLLTSTIRHQTLAVYHDLLESGLDHESAIAELKELALKDLELADEKIREELTAFSLSLIEDIHRGISEEAELKNSETYFLKGVRERSKYLSEKVENLDSKAKVSFKDYSSKSELLKELVSQTAGASSPSGSSHEVKSDRELKTEAEISLQVKMEYLGVTIEAGPQINFKREYVTSASVLTEGLTPSLLSNGNFDFWKRDQHGKIVKVKGKEVKRNISFTCQTELNFSTEYSGSGGFKFMGAGASASVSKTFSNSVSLNSKRVAVPEYIENKSVTLKFLAELCHADFLRTKVSSNLTVKDALNVSMKNVISGLRFSHPETKCASDKDCVSWFNKQKVDKQRSTARCLQSPGREKFFRCEARGHKGYSCPVVKNGQRLSLGIGELSCDKGLRCVEGKLQSYRTGENLKFYVEATCL